jgi:hypothetical protein
MRYEVYTYCIHIIYMHMHIYIHLNIQEEPDEHVDWNIVEDWCGYERRQFGYSKMSDE